MPKPPTYPTLFDEVKTVSISFLKRHGYLKPEQWQRGAIQWIWNGERAGGVSIVVDNISSPPHLELDYTYNGKRVNYQVQLVSIPSNLGNGRIWFFVCPHTGMKARKLYGAGPYFLHRSAFDGMYSKQTYGKELREIDAVLSPHYRKDEILKQLNAKHFKTHYAGKPTKRYLKLTNQLQTTSMNIAGAKHSLVL